MLEIVHVGIYKKLRYIYQELILFTKEHKCQDEIVAGVRNCPGQDVLQIEFLAGIHHD